MSGWLAVRLVADNNNSTPNGNTKIYCTHDTPDPACVCVRFVLTLLSASEEKVCGKRSLLRISEFCGATVSPITLHTAKTLDTPIFLLISRQKVGSLIKISGRVIIHTSLGVGRQNVSD